MRRQLLALAFGLVLLPQQVLAHEQQTYEIGEEQYHFVVGSIGEPIVVDDKTGVEIVVSKMSEPHHHDEAGEAEAGHEDAMAPVEGLDKSLQVEISAGNNKKVLALSPIYGKPGSYRASFIPTIQTTYAYRFFGTIDNTPVDLSFVCNPAGHPLTEENGKEVEVSEGVTRLSKLGSFGCPLSKADLVFPEGAATIHELDARVQALEVNSTSGSLSGFNAAALAAGFLGLSMGVLAFIKSSKSTRNTSK